MILRMGLLVVHESAGIMCGDAGTTVHYVWKCWCRAWERWCYVVERGKQSL